MIDAVAFCADGAATVTVNWPVEGAVPVALIANGFGVHVTPGGSVEQVTLTFCMPVEPAAGVTVIVEVPMFPAVTGEGDTAVALSVKLFVTVMVIAVAVES